MAKRRSKTKRKPSPEATSEQKRSKAALELLSSVQNQTWLKAFPKWGYSPTKLDDLPLELLKEIFINLDPVDAFAFTKANYPRLESTWALYGPSKVSAWAATVASDTHLVPTAYSRRITIRQNKSVVRFSFHQKSWILSSAITSSSCIWQQGLRGTVHERLLHAGKITHRPKHACAPWQTRFWFWIEQIFAYHMRVHHQNDTSFEVFRCIYTCEEISLPLSATDGDGDIPFIRAPYIAIRLNADKQDGCANRRFRPGERARDMYHPGAVQENVLLTQMYLKFLVAHVQMKALIGAFERNEQVRYVKLLDECEKYLRVFMEDGSRTVMKMGWGYPLRGC